MSAHERPELRPTGLPVRRTGLPVSHTNAMLVAVGSALALARSEGPLWVLGMWLVVYAGFWVDPDLAVSSCVGGAAMAIVTAVTATSLLEALGDVVVSGVLAMALAGRVDDRFDGYVICGVPVVVAVLSEGDPTSQALLYGVALYSSRRSVLAATATLVPVLTALATRSVAVIDVVFLVTLPLATSTVTTYFANAVTALWCEHRGIHNNNDDDDPWPWWTKGRPREDLVVAVAMASSRGAINATTPLLAAAGAVAATSGNNKYHGVSIGVVLAASFYFLKEPWIFLVSVALAFLNGSAVSAAHLSRHVSSGSPVVAVLSLTTAGLPRNYFHGALAILGNLVEEPLLLCGVRFVAAVRWIPPSDVRHGVNVRWLFACLASPRGLETTALFAFKVISVADGWKTWLRLGVSFGGAYFLTPSPALALALWAAVQATSSKGQDVWIGILVVGVAIFLVGYPVTALGVAVGATALSVQNWEAIATASAALFVGSLFSDRRLGTLVAAAPCVALFAARQQQQLMLLKTGTSLGLLMTLFMRSLSYREATLVAVLKLLAAREREVLVKDDDYWVPPEASCRTLAMAADVACFDAFLLLAKAGSFRPSAVALAAPALFLLDTSKTTVIKSLIVTTSSRKNYVDYVKTVLSTYVQPRLRHFFRRRKAKEEEEPSEDDLHPVVLDVSQQSPLPPPQKKRRLRPDVHRAVAPLVVATTPLLVQSLGAPLWALCSVPTLVASLHRIAVTSNDDVLLLVWPLSIGTALFASTHDARLFGLVTALGALTTYRP